MVKCSKPEVMNNLTKLKELRQPKTQHRGLMAGNPAKRPTEGAGHAAGGNALFLDTVLAPPFGVKRWKGKMNKSINKMTVQ